MDRPSSEFDAGRIRRARNRGLAAQRDLANRTTGTTVSRSQGG
ncbi:DUF6284 family protein [Streptomyces sp. NBC_01343]